MEGNSARFKKKKKSRKKKKKTESSVKTMRKTKKRFVSEIPEFKLEDG